VLVGGDLHLDVAGGGDEPLEVNALIAEGGARLAAGQPEQALELVGVAGQLDSPPAATAGCLDQ